MSIANLSAIFTVQGRTDQLKWKLQNHWPIIIKTSWSLWVPAQLINFRFVPVRYQLLFGNLVAVLWAMYISFAANTRGELGKKKKKKTILKETSLRPDAEAQVAVSDCRSESFQ
jgi:hypothetical protein